LLAARKSSKKNNRETTEKQQRDNRETTEKQQRNNRETTEKQQRNNRETTEKQQRNNRETTEPPRAGALLSLCFLSVFSLLFVCCAISFPVSPPPEHS
jgi:Flp pilus assembly protein TadB